MNDANALRCMHALAECLEPSLRESAPVRALVGALGEWLRELAATTRPERGAAALQAPPIASDAVPGATPIAGPVSEPIPAAGTPLAEPKPLQREVPTPSPQVTTLLPLRLGNAEVAVPVVVPRADAATRRATNSEGARLAPQLSPSIRGPVIVTAPTAAFAPPAPAVGILERIAERAALKATSCREVAALTRRGLLNSEEFRLCRDTLIERAKAIPSCFLWIFYPGKRASSADALDQIAQCYTALSEAATLADRLFDDTTGKELRAGPQVKQKALAAVAEASSALREALRATWLERADDDQEAIHRWLVDATARHGIFVERHMRLDDPADPAAAGELIADISAMKHALDRGERTRHESKKLLQKLGYHAKQSLEERDPGTVAQQWDKLESILATLATHGVRPTSDEVRSVLQSLRQRQSEASPTPEPNHPLLTAALAPLAPATIEEEADEPWVPSARISRVRDLLHGRSIVLIGGEPRPVAIASLEEAFGTTVLWPKLKEHGPGAAMVAPIRRAETALVIVIIKLAGHLQASEARELAGELKKPCVFATGGYNPEQLAEAILQQAEERLALG